MSSGPGIMSDWYYYSPLVPAMPPPTWHTRTGYVVQLANGNDVHFDDRIEAGAYGVKVGRTVYVREYHVRCGLERGNKFCSHGDHGPELSPHHPNRETGN